MSEPTDIDNDDEEAFAEATLTEAIENQIESDNPPAAKATFRMISSFCACSAASWPRLVR